MIGVNLHKRKIFRAIRFVLYFAENKTEPKFLEWFKQSEKDIQGCSSAKEIVIEI